jgi:hypothetical protein
MLVVLHVGIALASLIYAGYVYLSPSKAKIYGAYALVAATLTSGTALTIATHAALLSVCMTGLLYLGVVSAGIIAAHKKLAKEQILD